MIREDGISVHDEIADISKEAVEFIGEVWRAAIGPDSRRQAGGGSPTAALLVGHMPSGMLPPPSLHLDYRSQAWLGPRSQSTLSQFVRPTDRKRCS